MKCHNMEQFIEATIAINVKHILSDKENLPTPIDGLYLWSGQFLEIAGVIITSGIQMEELIHYELPHTTLPIADEQDPLLEEFIQTQHLDEDDFSWGDYDEMPECLYRMESIEAAKQVAKVLKTSGVEFTKHARIGIMIEDEIYDDVNDFIARTQDSLSDLPPELAQAFLRLFYQSPESKSYLLEACTQPL